MAELLFSYGTLQLEQVQLDTFGRLLNGTKDELAGYAIKQLEIKDESVLFSSNERFHPIAVVSSNHEDRVKGMVFELTHEELMQADSYEVEDYKRISVTLASGKNAWIYVSKF